MSPSVPVSVVHTSFLAYLSMMALSAEGLSEPERILHHTSQILINIIGFLDILCQFRQFSFAEHMAYKNRQRVGRQDLNRTHLKII